MITDTQVLSYYYKETLPRPDAPVLISSITAAEFLLIQSGSPNTANYYPMLPARIKHRIGGLFPGQPSIPRMLVETQKQAAMGKRRTDQLILNFNGKLPSIIEFGSIAISQIINDGHEDIFAASIAHLEKEQQRKLRNKLSFLTRIGTRCLSVTPAIADVGLNILGQFLEKYEAKQNVRNTINDMLILSTAIEHSLPLLTEDNLLRRFTAELLGAPCRPEVEDRVIIDFAASDVADRRKPFESKGYINRGWQVMERRGIR